MTTEAQKRAHAAHRERLKAQGVRSVTIRLSPPAWDRLDALAKVHGSKDKAVEAMLLDAGGQAEARADVRRLDAMVAGKTPEQVVAMIGEMVAPADKPGLDLPLGNIRRATPKGAKR